MNNDFDRKPEEGGEEENPIRRGYDAAPVEEPAPAAEPAPAEESTPAPESNDNPEYRFKAETPSGGENYYYDYTSSMKTEPEAAQSAPTCSPEELERYERASTVSLIMGIIGVAVVWMCCGGLFVSLLLGIIGLIFAGKSRSPITGNRSGKGTTGFVLSLISTILGACGFFFWIFYIFIIVLAIAEGETDVGGGEVYIRNAIEMMSHII